MIHFGVTMFQLAATEKALLVVLLVASLAGFGWRFGAVLLRIRAAKPDADFSLWPIASRVRELVWEVMLQAKVIRERPLPGLAHAFVFWGFCAFALVTLNHVAIGFGARFLPPGSFYFQIAAVFAVLVAIGIAGLFIRRFVVRPKWLGELSWESGVIALLIFVLMATYLDALWIGDSKTLWWAHTRGAAHLPPLDPAHQASAPGPQPVFDFPLARRLCENSTTRR